MDVVVNAGETALAVAPGTRGPGVFDAGKAIRLALPISRGITAALAGDVDGNGLPDIIVTHAVVNGLALTAYLNESK